MGKKKCSAEKISKQLPPGTTASAPLGKKIEMLENLRELNEVLTHFVVIISQRFYDEKHQVSRYNTEHLAGFMQMTAMAAHPSNPAYAQFLREQVAVLDAIGREQRRFFFNVQDKIVIPLREWRYGDYVFIREEVNRLNVIGKTLKRLKFNEMTVQDFVNKERMQNEYDKQLLQVLNQLNNLERIQHSHMSVLTDFTAIVLEYGRAVERLFAPEKENETPVYA